MSLCLIFHKISHFKREKIQETKMVFFPNMNAFILQMNYNFVTALLSHLLWVQSHILVLFREHAILGFFPANNQCRALWQKLNTDAQMDADLMISAEPLLLVQLLINEYLRSLIHRGWKQVGAMAPRDVRNDRC